jgi:RNA polymerase sigma-70 factor, ECF subfamily
MNIPSEQDLLEGARTFNLNSLAVIYDSYAKGLFVYSMRLLGDEHQARDCVSETFSRFLKALKDGNGPKSYLKAYLYRTAHNWITDIYRRSPPPPIELKENIQAEESISPESQFETRMDHNKLHIALHRLPPEQRQVIMLRFIEGWEFSDIAQALQKPEGTIRVIQYRGLEILKKILL